ncbi:KDO2-lipid IV(A) lauroyltransferase [Kitasatospora paracochleata]|uniref:KDO2-lipid IV(A) lauroyltransferase n=1 Tax=Kitasatospora paracochleata TaxID=58354 RepID=A0ABT1IUN1_9ACTN|nr:phosphatidylinositol mannoside acyltransferase [Kitasatospora paracochleata]MCP2308850.1 KDO2-lipid IV(A) lauroyltransferase [Kitasatospora paracochleata]
MRQLEANLARVHPDADAARLRELSRAGMRSYLRYWMESFRLPTWSLDRIAAAMRGQGPGAAARGDGGRPRRDPGPAAHGQLGPGRRLDRLGRRLPVTTVAERLKPESLFDRFVAYREGLGMEVLALTGSDISVVGTLAAGCARASWSAWSRPRPVRAGRAGRLSSASRPGCRPGPAAGWPSRTGAALFPVTLWYDGPVMHAEVHPEVRAAHRGRQERAGRTP